MTSPSSLSYDFYPSFSLKYAELFLYYKPIITELTGILHTSVNVWMASIITSYSLKYRYLLKKKKSWLISHAKSHLKGNLTAFKNPAFPSHLTKTPHQ